MVFRRIFFPFVWAASGLYWLGLTSDRARKLRRTKRLGKPVVSIGNITVGGTGKTPLLIRLVRDLQARGVRPAVLSRNYQGWSAPSPAGVAVGPSATAGANDEIRLMSEKLPDVPIGMGPDRFRSAQALASSHSVDMFLLDDGFQHWPLARSLDVVCVDGADPFGGGHLLPWGRLREPVSALHRASMVVVTRAELLSSKDRAELESRLSLYVPKSKIAFGRFEFSLRHSAGTAADLLILKNRTVLAFSAIGHPAAFEKNLASLGARVLPRRFTDHHSFTELEVKGVIKEAQDMGALVVITEKDAVKVGLRDDALYILEASLEFRDSDRDLWGRFLHECSNLSLRG